MTLEEEKNRMIAAFWEEYVQYNFITEQGLHNLADALLEEVAKTVDAWEIPLEKMNMRSRGDIARNKLAEELASAIRSGKGK